MFLLDQLEIGNRQLFYRQFIKHIKIEDSQRNNAQRAPMSFYLENSCRFHKVINVRSKLIDQTSPIDFALTII
jgi:hypothetical protein